MSEPIQSIAQNNYLLSNLNAQKLYAQSPLTTGVSGTSAYIGLEPSARYNETVLWSGDQVGSAFTITASEPPTNFQYIYVLGHTNDTVPNQFNFFSDTHQLSITTAMQLSDYQFTTWGEKLMNICIKSNGEINPEVTKERKWDTTSYTGMNTFGIYKVVGINRKENV